MNDYVPSAPAPSGYKYGPQGQLIHTIYDESGYADLGIKGTVIPSAKIGAAVGGNVAFDPHSEDLPQQIVECTESGMRVLSVTTRAAMAAKEAAERASVSTAVSVETSEQVASSTVGKLAIDLADRGGEMAKKLVKKRTKRPKRPARAETSQRVEKTPEVAAPPSVPVTISGVFGQSVQHVSAVFRAGNLVILAVDHRQLSTLCELPQLQDDAMPLQVSWAGQTVPCLWAGVKFTLPDGSITFMLLFVNEEQQDAEGFSGEARPNEV